MKTVRPPNATELAAIRKRTGRADYKPYKATTRKRQRAGKPSLERYPHHHCDRTLRRQMSQAQRSRCAICSVSGKQLVVDHDRTTGSIRSLLCRTCKSHVREFESLYERTLHDPDRLAIRSGIPIQDQVRLYLLRSRQVSSG